eukprot:358800-Prorocentrum_minimum.AAC.1
MWQPSVSAAPPTASEGSLAKCVANLRAASSSAPICTCSYTRGGPKGVTSAPICTCSYARGAPEGVTSAPIYTCSYTRGGPEGGHNGPLLGGGRGPHRQFGEAGATSNTNEYACFQMQWFFQIRPLATF